MIKLQQPPACSVVLPVRNAADTLPRCLASIRAQTLRDFELIVIDDESSDGSTEVIGSHARSDDRIRTVRPGRVGLVQALNIGIAESRSSCVARMDADDYMHPSRLEAQVGFLAKRPDIAVAGCRVRLKPENRIQAGYRAYVAWQNRLLEHREIADDIFVESPLAHPSVMFRKGAVVAAGGYRDGDFPEDYELWLRLHELGYRFARLPEVLLDWYESPGRTSRVDGRYRRAAFDRLRARYLSRDRRLREAKRVIVWGAGQKTRKRVRILGERGVDFECWVDIDPAKVGRTLWDRPIREPEYLEKHRPGTLVLVYVTNHGAREQISAFLDRHGYRRGRDYLCVG